MAVVFAGVRDPSRADALNQLAQKAKNVHVVPYTSPDEISTRRLADLIKEKAGKVDVVIANAGTQLAFDPLIKCSARDLSQTFNVNVVGPILLFQALHPLLAASSAPQFVGISSSLGSVALAIPDSPDAYCISKAALNSAVARIALNHGKKDGINAYVLHPGLVATDMGDDYMSKAGIPNSLAVSADESAEAIVRFVDGATRVKTGGKFFDAVKGVELPW
ncbi:hypothetical protein Rhopal_003899-T1 [Rhodotorula paludigena]|uniref:Uncharacterized protein n=1 Tax=Rhodotorula paludigena TaxID=86838 RepID=A0AAV5GMZ0_9BASI|nr:hypothetical protein Rhopal_003899-T1 [Rhodotorula paludigena]